MADAGSGQARRVAARLAVPLVAGLLAVPAGGAYAQEDDGSAAPDGEVIQREAEPDEQRIAATRFSGRQRFATAALIALETWEQNGRAVLARHDEWPDALAGGYLAGVYNAPVLLISQQNLQDDTLTALEALGVSEVTILGGTQAISEENETRLRDDHGYEVTRVSGATRFETAAAIAREGGLVGDWGGRRTAFVATGINFADALTAGPLAYDGNFPILLTPSQSLHAAVEQALQDLDIEQVVLLGGRNAVSTEVEEEIRDAIEGDEDSVLRLSGSTRIETAIEVADFAVAELGFAPLHHGWARGNEFADALTIGPRLGELGGPLLLVPTPSQADTGAGSNAAFAGAVGCRTARIDIAGGHAAMSPAVEDGLRELLACPDQPLLIDLAADPDTAFQRDWIDLTATVRSNTGVAVEEVEITVEVVHRSPAAATVNFRADQDSPPQPDAITVQTGEDGVAQVQVSSDQPAEVHVVAGHLRDDGVHIEAGAQVAFTAHDSPPPPPPPTPTPTPTPQ